MTTRQTLKARRSGRLTAAATCAALTLGWAEVASAQSTILRPGDRPAYTVELEPHLAVAPLEPPGTGTGSGVGVGFRGTIEIVPDGFIPRLNDSIGLGIGFDGLRYPGTGEVSGRCARFEPGPLGTRVCVEVDGYGGDSDYLFHEVVMQWNFWLHDRWSVFGEPGLAVYVLDGGDLGLAPVFQAGGRFHFSDRLTLTLRLGYPAFSLGVSFLL
jgi:hypothetical protein